MGNKTDDETERRRHVKHPTRGPWAWREFLPQDQAQLDALRLLTLERKPEGVDPWRFLAWVEAEMAGEGDTVISPRGRAISKYRKALYELMTEPFGGDPERPIIHVPALPYAA